MCGDHRDGNIERLVGDVFDDGETLAVGKAHVGKAQVECLRVEEPDCFADGLRASRVEAHAGKCELEQFEQIGLVVDDEHLRLPTIACLSNHFLVSPYFLEAGSGRALERHAKIRARAFWQQLERRTVGIGQLSRNIQAEAGATRPRREERLENLCPKLRRYARSVVR